MFGQEFDTSGFNRDRAGAAVPSAASSIDLHSVCLCQIQQRPSAVPLRDLAGTTKGNLQRGRVGNDGGGGRRLLYCGGTESLEEDALLRNAPGFEVVGDALHHRTRSANI